MFRRRVVLNGITLKGWAPYTRFGLRAGLSGERESTYEVVVRSHSSMAHWEREGILASRWLNSQKELPALKGYLQNYQRSAARFALSPGWHHLRGTFMRDEIAQGRSGQAFKVLHTASKKKRAVKRPSNSLITTTRNAMVSMASSTWNAATSVVATVTCVFLF